MIRAGMTCTVRGYAGVAFYVLRARHGRVIVRMVGDDKKWDVPVDDCTPLKRKAFCGVCGQLGCTHDGLERKETR